MGQASELTAVQIENVINLEGKKMLLNAFSFVVLWKMITYAISCDRCSQVILQPKSYRNVDNELAKSKPTK